MSGDDLLSKKLADIEEHMKGFIARRVESSDNERVDARPVDSGPTAAAGGEPETTVDILTPGGDDRYRRRTRGLRHPAFYSRVTIVYVDRVLTRQENLG